MRDGQPIQYGGGRAEEALRYAMSLPVATTICGIDSLDVLHQNVGIARGFKPMSPQEMQALRERCRPSSGMANSSCSKQLKNTTAALGESSMVIRRRNNSRCEPIHAERLRSTRRGWSFDRSNRPWSMTPVKRADPSFPQRLSSQSGQTPPNRHGGAGSGKGKWIVRDSG